MLLIIITWRGYNWTMSEVDINQKLRGFLESAFQKLSVKDYREAIDDLKAAEELDSNNPEVLFNLGISYCRMERYSDAIPYFEKLLDLPYSFVDVITVNVIYSYALIVTGAVERALECLQEVLSLSPNNATILNMTGYCYEKMRKYPESIATFKSVLEIDKHNYNAYNSLAYILTITGGDLNEALRYGKISLEADPENPAYLDTVGYIYLKKGSLDTSKKYLKRALAKLPDSEEIKEHVNELLKIDVE
jgi:tetratricopeptide (TPR) repeat protein